MPARPGDEDVKGIRIKQSKLEEEAHLLGGMTFKGKQGRIALAQTRL